MTEPTGGTPIIPGNQPHPWPPQQNPPTAKRSRLWLVLAVAAGVVVMLGTTVGITIAALGESKDPVVRTAATASPSATPSAAPAVDYATACTEAVRLLTGDALGIVSDFVKDPSMASISDGQLNATLERMYNVAPGLPAEVTADWEQLTRVLVSLQSAKDSGSNATIATGTFPELAPAVFTKCGPYVPDGALGTATPATTPAAKPKPKAKVVPTIDEGTWTVGEDIPAGTYKVVEVAGSECYWARLKPNGDIIDNYLGGGRPKVTLRKGETFETNGCPLFKKQ